MTDDYDDYDEEKKFLSFSWNLVDLQFKVNKSTVFPSFLILLKRGGKKSDSSLKFQKNFTKDFLGKKNIWELFVKSNSHIKKKERCAVQILNPHASLPRAVYEA